MMQFVPRRQYSTKPFFFYGDEVYDGIIIQPYDLLSLKRIAISSSLAIFKAHPLDQRCCCSCCDLLQDFLPGTKLITIPMGQSAHDDDRAHCCSDGINSSGNIIQIQKYKKEEETASILISVTFSYTIAIYIKRFLLFYELAALSYRKWDESLSYFYEQLIIYKKIQKRRKYITDKWRVGRVSSTRNSTLCRHEPLLFRHYIVRCCASQGLRCYSALD